MRQQITAEQVTRESKQAQGKIYWGIKHGDNWFNLIVNDKPQRGARFVVDVKETQWNGRTTGWAMPVIEESKPHSSNHHIAWEDYKKMALEASSLAHQAAV